MRGLLHKSVREVWLTTLVFALALSAAMSLLTFVLPKVQEGIGEIFSKLPFVKTLIAALVGTDISGELNAQLMQSVLWIHPVVLAIVWSHGVILCTRLPAGEIDRGTIDLLLGLPVRRAAVFVAETIVWLAAGAVILFSGACGHIITAAAIPAEMRPALRSVLYEIVNLYGIYLVVGSISFLISSMSDHRDRAVGVVFGLVLISFLVNFVAPFWPLAKPLSIASFMHYYQPAQIMRGGDFPLRDITVLCAASLATWVLAAVVFSRRDICTV